MTAHHKHFFVGSAEVSQALGLVPVGERNVSSVPHHLLALVPKPTDDKQIVKGTAPDPIKDTVPLMKKLIKRQLWQGKKLAEALKGNSVTETARNFWNFIFSHIQYKGDGNDEVIRSLRKLIHGGFGDCDCFTTALSNMLLNVSIPHFLRVAGYNGSSEFSHIYIVIPKNKSLATDSSGNMLANDYITLDCVPHKFNYEEAFTSHKDFPMRLVALDGLEQSRRNGYGYRGSVVTGMGCPSNNAMGCPTLTTLGCSPSPSTLPVKPKPGIVYVSEKQLYNSGLVDMKEQLNTVGIPAVDKGITLEVSTPEGVVEINRFENVNKAGALREVIKQAVTNPAPSTAPVLIASKEAAPAFVDAAVQQASAQQTQQTLTASAPEVKKIAAWGLAVAAGLTILGSMRPAKKSAAVAGLNGPAKHMRKLKVN